jgi:hypothetical protein
MRRKRITKRNSTKTKGMKKRFRKLHERDRKLDILRK